MRWFQSFKDHISSTGFWLRWALVLLPWGIFYLLIPPFHIPDEYSHYTYVQALAHGHYPYLTKADCWSEEVHFFANQYKEGSSTIVYAPRVNQPVPATLNDEAICSTQAQHPPFYYLIATGIYKLATVLNITGIDRYNVVRLTSLGFFIIFLVYAEKLFGVFFDKRLTKWMRLLLVFQPLLLSMTTHVNPEIALITLTTITLYYLSVFLQHQMLNLWQVVGLAILATLTFYSKVTGVILMPVIALSLGFLVKFPWLDRLKSLLIFGLIFGVFTAPYFAWNYHLYGKPLENGLMYLVVETHFPKVISKTMQVGYIVEDLFIALLQLPGDIGRIDVLVFSELKSIYMFILLLGVGFGILRSFTDQDIVQKWSQQRWVFLSVIALITLAITYLAYTYMWQAWLGPLLQGRYLLFGMIPVGVFFFWGVFGLLKTEPEKILKVLLIMSIFYFNFLIWWLWIPRFYL